MKQPSLRLRHTCHHIVIPLSLPTHHPQKANNNNKKPIKPNWVLKFHQTSKRKSS
jgi:hypothetical protein